MRIYFDFSGYTRMLHSGMTEEQRVEVFRKAHELSLSHGRNAQRYAAGLAAGALADEKTDECEFWKAVEATLKPRDEAN
jgi:hypothetical protein